MTDIFFSYSSLDRERVRPIRDALVAQGFDVFWDQHVPAGMDWDSWIRQHLTKSKCAIAFWSTTSASSDNVRHEATVAKQQGKLISVLLEPLTAEQFPLGFYAQQAANLSGWNGDCGDDEWKKFRRDFETKLTPLWMRRQIDELEAELVGERARRDGAERRDRVLQAQIAKEALAQQDLKQERDKALEEVATLQATIEKLTRAGAEAAAREVEAERRERALQAQIAKEVEAYQDLKRERDKALEESAARKSTVWELTQARADAPEPPPARRISGNIYLAKVTRVEPSLSGALVNYGNEFHGFLPFDNIHPDYYQIPVVDRQRLCEQMAGAGSAGEGSTDRGDAAKENPPSLAHKEAGALQSAGAENEVSVPPRVNHSYKIQEVIKGRQVMLAQVEREPLANRGALLTTYLSLPGQYVVLTPTIPRNAISREITDLKERERLVEIIRRLSVPEGMGVILRASSASRTEAEIASDFARLMQQWETARDLTLMSTAPALVYDPAAQPTAPRA